jgi:hypothetical protein
MTVRLSIDEQLLHVCGFKNGVRASVVGSAAHIEELGRTLTTVTVRLHLPALNR